MEKCFQGAAELNRPEPAEIENEVERKFFGIWFSLLHFHLQAI